MLSTRSFERLVFISFCVVLTWGVYLQSTLLINWDASTLTRDAKIILEGGHFGKDFLEINPPLAIFIYLPVAFFEKHLAISPLLILRLYLFSLASLAFYLSFLMSKKVFAVESRFWNYLFLLMLLIVDFIYPMIDFGEREHFILLFTLPYFLLLTALIKGCEVRLSQKFIIGLLAGIAFAIKPFYLITFGLAELYFYLQKKRLSCFCRIESIIIYSCVIIYFLYLVIFYQYYLSFFVPLVLRFYYISIKQSWDIILLSPPVIYCFCIMIWFLVMMNKLKLTKTLSTLLFIALSSFLAFYIFQKTAWSYHLLPSTTLALLLSVLLYWESFQLLKKIKCEFFIAPLLLSFCIAFPGYAISEYYKISKKYTTEQSEFILFLQKHAMHQSICSFQASIPIVFPAIDYADMSFPCRNLGLIWAPNAVRQHALEKNPERLKQLEQDENYLITQVFEDFKIKQPQFVLVDISENRYYDKFSINFLAYLFQNKDFKKLWEENYVYFATVKQLNETVFAVYKRKKYVSN